jgi:acetyl esterase/lipase
VSNQTGSYEPLTSQNAALVLVDHQAGLTTGVRDYSTGELKHNAVALARAAKALKLPISVTTTARDSMWGFLVYLNRVIPALQPWSYTKIVQSRDAAAVSGWHTRSRLMAVCARQSRKDMQMNSFSRFASLSLVGTIIMMPITYAAGLEAANDTRIDPQVRVFLAELNKDSSPFWELPQPKPQEILTALQNKTPVDMSGVTIAERTITQDGRTVNLYIMTPQHVTGNPGVLLFIHGGVWIAGNFQNHQRLLRDLVVGSGQIGVFVEYTPLPAARYPTQLEESYAALKWIATHAGDLGADGSRIAVAGNSVGGNMTAALTLMAKDKNGPKISYQVLLIPATDASVDTASYREFGTGRFLARAFMKYGWDLYAPDEKTRNSQYVSPLRASNEELKGLPPALLITAENDPLRDEGEAYAHKLTDAGVAVTATRYNGMIHDFVLLNAIREVPGVQAGLRQAGEAIREALKP